MRGYEFCQYFPFRLLMLIMEIKRNENELYRKKKYGKTPRHFARIP